MAMESLLRMLPPEAAHRMALAATLICCGGIQNQAHLHRAFAAGADAVEIYTALARHGTRRLTELLFAGAAAL